MVDQTPINGGDIPLETMIALLGPPIRSSDTHGPLVLELCMRPPGGGDCTAADCAGCPHR